VRLSDQSPLNRQPSRADLSLSRGQTYVGLTMSAQRCDKILARIGRDQALEAELTAFLLISVSFIQGSAPF
jgi:hypothetical protein